MGESSRKKQLKEVFLNVDSTEQVLIDRLLDDVAFLEARMDELRQMPFIEINPKKKPQQRPTAAARQYKECSQSYMNAIRILLSVLNKVDDDSKDELVRLLREFQ